jgi:hypothetical protein
MLDAPSAAIALIFRYARYPRSVNAYRESEGIMVGSLVRAREFSRSVSPVGLIRHAGGVTTKGALSTEQRHSDFRETP